MNQRKYQICTNCVMDTTDSAIIFDDNGVCDHCEIFYAIIDRYPERIFKTKQERTINFFGEVLKHKRILLDGVRKPTRSVRDSLRKE